MDLVVSPTYAYGAPSTASEHLQAAYGRIADSGPRACINFEGIEPKLIGLALFGFPRQEVLENFDC